jgi:hypothetical protein
VQAVWILQSNRRRPEAAIRGPVIMGCTFFRVTYVIGWAVALWVLWAPGWGAWAVGRNGYRRDEFGFGGWYFVEQGPRGYADGIAVVPLVWTAGATLVISGAVYWDYRRIDEKCRGQYGNGTEEASDL